MGFNSAFKGLIDLVPEDDLVGTKCTRHVEYV